MCNVFCVLCLFYGGSDGKKNWSRASVRACERACALARFVFCVICFCVICFCVVCCLMFCAVGWLGVVEVCDLLWIVVR